MRCNQFLSWHIRFFYISLQIQIDELEVIIILCLLIRSCFRGFRFLRKISRQIFFHICDILSGRSCRSLRCCCSGFCGRSFRSYRFTGLYRRTACLCSRLSSARRFFHFLIRKCFCAGSRSCGRSSLRCFRCHSGLFRCLLPGLSVFPSVFVVIIFVIVSVAARVLRCLRLSEQKNDHNDH